MSRTDLRLLKFEELLEDQRALREEVLRVLEDLRDEQLCHPHHPPPTTELILERLDVDGDLRPDRLDLDAGRLRVRLLLAVADVVAVLARAGWVLVQPGSVAAAVGEPLEFKFTVEALLGKASAAEAYKLGSRREPPAPANEGQLPAWAMDVIRTEEPLLTRERLRDLLQVSERTLSRLLSSGELVTIRRPGDRSKVLVPRLEVARYLARLARACSNEDAKWEEVA
ncbi:MAG: hypothetical protein AB7N76_12570 [Planctomycetota bacterium]